MKIEFMVDAYGPVIVERESEDGALCLTINDEGNSTTIRLYEDEALNLMRALHFFVDAEHVLTIENN